MEYWQKQTKDSPLYEDILWSRPETRNGAGKLLIIGGNLHGFSTVGQAYQYSVAAGVGVAHSLLPEALKKTIGNMLENTSYAPSTPSGSFGSDALNELLIQSSWSDAVLLAGDFGRNSETAILLEKYINKYNGNIIATKDSIEYFYNQPESILDRDGAVVVLNLSQLQKLGTASKFETPFILGMGLLLLIQALHEFTLIHKATVVTKELGNILVAKDGQVTSTKVQEGNDLWQVETAAKAGVFFIQNPNKPLEAITTSIIIN